MNPLPFINSPGPSGTTYLIKQKVHGSGMEKIKNKKNS
jgi:hypothetical protein